MYKQDFCHSCGHKDSCQEIYSKLGHEKGPSVLAEVLAAFLLPLLVFVGSLAAVKYALAKLVSSEELQTALSVGAALLAAFLSVLAVRAVGAKSK
jgi:hypothetical protein